MSRAELYLRRYDSFDYELREFRTLKIPCLSRIELDWDVLLAHENEFIVE